MTEMERSLLNARIGELLHEILVMIRNTAHPIHPDEQDRRAEIKDLADLAHNWPRYIVGNDEFGIQSFESLRSEVVKHIRKFHPNSDPGQHRYLMILDMDAEAFLTRFRDHNWNHSEPELATV